MQKTRSIESNIAVVRTEEGPLKHDGKKAPPSKAVLRHAEREAAWFFRELGGIVPEGSDAATRASAEQVDNWLRAILAFHRGVFRLLHVPRSWPKGIRREFGDHASIVVRIECALYPAVGVSTEALERASVERLTESIRLRDRIVERRAGGARELAYGPAGKNLRRAARRAGKHVALAVQALARARGTGPCVVPTARVK